MQPVPLCSVIVVSHNSGPALSDCVRSVLESDLPLKLLVSDNGSDDGSLEALRADWGSDPRLLIRKNGRNLGFARAGNRVLAEASGQWILFLNPDCVIEPDTIARMIAVTGPRTEVGISGCLLRNPDGSEQAGCRRREPTPLRSLARVLHLRRLDTRAAGSMDFNLAGTPLPEGPVAVDAISGAFMLVRRAALERVGPLDEDYFLHCEDLDWCRRFRDKGYQVLFVPDVEVLHLKGVSSRSRPVWVEWHKHRGMLRYYRKFYGNSRSVLFGWMVGAAVWGRFIALIPVIVLRKWLR